MNRYLIDKDPEPKIYHAFSYTSFTWKSHTQNSYELVTVQRGSLTAQIGGRTYSVCKGQSLLIPPFVFHSYQEEENCAYSIATFTPAYAPDFHDEMQKFPPSEYLFQFPKEEWELLAKRLFPLPIENGSLEQPTPDEYTIKACVYLIAARFLEEE